MSTLKDYSNGKCVLGTNGLKTSIIRGVLVDSFSYHIKHFCRLYSLGRIAWFFCFRRRGFVPYCFFKYHASSNWDLSCIHMLCEYAAEHVCVRSCVFVCMYVCVLTHACAECSCVPDLIFHRKMNFHAWENSKTKILQAKFQALCTAADGKL